MWVLEFMKKKMMIHSLVPLLVWTQMGTSERKVQGCPFIVAAWAVNRSETLSVNKDSIPVSMLMLFNKTNRSIVTVSRAACFGYFNP